MIKSKTKQAKTAKFETYRICCNKLIDFLRLVDNPLSIFFEQSKNNSKVLWQGIKNIIYSKKNKDSTSPSSIIVDEKNIPPPPPPPKKKDMVGQSSNFFTSVKKQDNIPHTKNNFKNDLKSFEKYKRNNISLLL